MAGKNTKNPLLTGASIGFPFENFSNSALLVPVSPQNEPALLPEEIEADSFLGQGPPSNSNSNISSRQFSKPQFPDPTRSPDLQSLPPSLSSIPVFTQSYTGSTSPAKPTPIYADALNTQFNQTLSFEPLQLHNNDSYFSHSRETSSDSDLRQPPPTQTTPLFFSNQNPSYTAPTIFTPAITTTPVLLDPPPSGLSNHTPSPVTSVSPVTQPIFNYFSAPEPSQQNKTPSVPLFSPAVTSPRPVQPSSPSVPPASVPPASVPPASVPPASVPPASVPPPPQAPEANAPPPSGGAHNSYRLSNIKRPTYTRPPELSVTPMAAMPSPAPPPVAPAPATNTLFTPRTVDSTAPAPVPVSTMFPSVLPSSAPPSISTPPSSTSSPAPTLVPSAPAAPVPVSTMFPSVLPPTVPPSISAPPSSTSSPAPTLVPSAPATVSVTAAPATLYRPPQPQSPNTPSVLPPSFANLAQGASYRPVYCHWFFKKVVEGKVLWFPFSMSDSLALEQAFTSPTISPDTKVATDGGRYDVEVLRRRRTAVYWEEDPSEVRRCSWFVKGSMDVRFVPYEENVATMLEEEYRIAATTNEWNRHVSLPDGEMIVIHSLNAIAHHTRSASPDVWGNSPQMQQKPRVVKRGMDEFDISEGEPEKVDHLLFLVHGIGKFCDLKFRPVTEVVDDFRSVSLQLLQSHFKSAVEAGQAGRVEVLPVSWHQALHNADIDTRLNNITLSSIPRLRHFTNDTLLDILFYTSPVFCETIVQAVGNELNRLYNLFVSRNPGYEGGVSLGGHSLGSLILFDMLCNQVPVASPSPPPQDQPSTPTNESQEISGEEHVKTLGCMRSQKARLSRTVSYLTIGNAGTGQPFISYPQLVFRPKAFFALGSPIGMFVTVRGIESLGEDFALPTCPMFFNIFHPFDPVAYRIESLITSEFAKYSPVLIPHHKGRKRMHLELKETLEHVGTALKEQLIKSVRTAWSTVTMSVFQGWSDNRAIEQEVNKVLESEMMQSCGDAGRSDTPDVCPEPDIKMGQLNGGRRVDYVLQEAPLESFNEYLFALSSHVCYWESEDTMLMMLKEIYSTMGVSPDTQVVQQILPFEEPGATGHYSGGMDPTAPPSDNISSGPPPISGFVRGHK